MQKETIFSRYSIEKSISVIELIEIFCLDRTSLEEAMLLYLPRSYEAPVQNRKAD